MCEPQLQLMLCPPGMHGRTWRHSRGLRGGTACGSCPLAPASSVLQPCGSHCARTTRSTMPGLILPPGSELGSHTEEHHVHSTVQWSYREILVIRRAWYSDRLRSSENVLDSFRPGCSYKGIGQ